MDFAVKLAHGDAIRVTADGFNVLPSGALVFANRAGKRISHTLVLAPHAWERLQPLAPPPKVAPPPPTAKRRSAAAPAPAVAVPAPRKKRPARKAAK